MYSSYFTALYRYILTGSYDSMVRVYNHSQQLLHTIGGHSGPVAATCWIQSSSETGATVVSGSHDGTARITKITALETETTTGPLYASASLRLHTSPLSSVAANRTGAHIVTAGWDGLLGVFTTDIPEKDEVFDDDDLELGRKKRRKVESSAPHPKRKVNHSPMVSGPRLIYSRHLFML